MISGKDRLLSLLPPRLAWESRGLKNRRDLHGLHAAAASLQALVPPGVKAVDVGANRGLYSYWISRSAQHVHAVEPNPLLAEYLRRVAPRTKVTVHECALAAHTGTAHLVLDGGRDGEARLTNGDQSSADSTIWEVETTTLDRLVVDPIGFLKIDAEGHEFEILSGARRHLTESRPVIFVELEERHRSGAVAETTDLLLETYRYSSAKFFRRGELLDIDKFEARRDQDYERGTNRPGYVSNFVFHP